MSKKYRKNVCIVVFNQDKKLLVCERLDSHGETLAWQFPQGGIDKGETVVEAAKREIFEETSLKNIKIVQANEAPFRYDFPQDVVERFKDSFHGQDQHWVLAFFNGEDSEINIHTKIPEFYQWKWADAEFAISHIVPFKREVYEKGLSFFTPLIEKFKA
ncbi:MAG: RNA pyrophosphohydrolase [Alphaproteobacteria bacterium]|nr:RNA pyrophosphohydrolase [Alphaproteobacteria bacterium]